MFTSIWFKDTLERIVKTTAQGFVAALILASSYHLDAYKGLIFALIAAGLCAAKGIVATVIPSNVSPASFATGPRRYVADIVERLLFSFLEGFAAALIVNYHLSGLRSAAMAGVMAAASVVTSLLSLSLPSPVSPASLVPGPAVATPTRA